MHLKELFKKKSKPPTVKGLKFSKYLWLTILIIDVALVVLLTVTFLACYFMLPSVDVSITLPANVWMASLSGGIGRQFFMGFFVCFSYYQYKEAVNALKVLQEAKSVG